LLIKNAHFWRQCAYYNIAICKANLNDIQGCLEAISLAFDNGYNEPKRLLKDADFPEAIKQNKFFSDFIEKKIPPFPFSLLSR